MDGWMDGWMDGRVSRHQIVSANQFNFSFHFSYRQYIKVLMYFSQLNSGCREQKLHEVHEEHEEAHLHVNVHCKGNCPFYWRWDSNKQSCRNQHTFLLKWNSRNWFKFQSARLNCGIVRTWTVLHGGKKCAGLGHEMLRLKTGPTLALLPFMDTLERKSFQQNAPPHKTASAKKKKRKEKWESLHLLLPTRMTNTL